MCTCRVSGFTGIFLVFFMVSAQELVPVVTVTQVESQIYHGDNVTKTEANLKYISPSEAEYQVPYWILRLGLHCSASYPVSWKLESYEYSIRRVYGSVATHRRHVLNPYDYMSFNYSSGLTLVGGRNYMTGRYVCHSTRNHSVFVAVHLFWSAGLGMSDLVSNDQAVITLLQSDLGPSIVLPCLVSNPQQEVELTAYAFAHEGKRRSLPQDSYTYDPKVGFTLSNWQSGYYKCYAPSKSSAAGSTLWVIVPAPVNQSTTISPSMNSDRDQRKFTCCSGTRSPPTLLGLRCDHPLICEYYSQISPQILSKHVNSKNVRTKRNGCSILKLRKQSLLTTGGIIRCIGVGFDIYQPIIYSLEKTIVGKVKKELYKSTIISKGIWTSWSEIIPEQMMVITRRTIGVPTKSHFLYDGEQTTVVCVTTPYYFSAGMLFGIQFKNNTVKYISSPGFKWMERTDIFTPMDGHHGTIDINASLEMEAVFCMAPVWNSSLWATKLDYVIVKASHSPQIVNTRQSLQWALNDTGKEMVCLASGYPLPTMTWTKDDQDIGNETNINVTRSVFTQNDSVVTVLRILWMTEKDYGIYACVARSKVGNATYEFRIQKGQPESRHITAMAFGTVGSILLLASIAVLAWQLKRIRFKMQEFSQRLKSQPAEEIREISAFDLNNQTFNPGNMSRNLLKE